MKCGRKEREKGEEMQIAAMIMNTFYLILLIYAVINSTAPRKGNILISAGAAVSVLYTAVLLFAGNNWYLIEIAGMLLISAGALVNGHLKGKIHPGHHVVRGIFEAAVVLLFVFG